MKKNQIFIKCGTEYKEMTKELLEAAIWQGDGSLRKWIEGAFRKFRGRFTAE